MKKIFLYLLGFSLFYLGIFFGNHFIFKIFHKVEIRPYEVGDTIYGNNRSAYSKELFIPNKELSVFFVSYSGVGSCSIGFIDIVHENGEKESIFPIPQYTGICRAENKDVKIFPRITQNLPIPCPLGITYKKKNILEIPLCYASGRSSGECDYAVMHYNLKTKKWTFQSIGFMSGSLSGGNNIPFGVRHLINFLMTRGIQNNIDMALYKFLYQLRKNNLLESEKNIPKIYQ